METTHAAKKPNPETKKSPAAERPPGVSFS